MYLKRITINGFKSFAHKTVIELEPGVTAVVGPNGSGKSNVADAIRWAMGEQSKAKLRLGDREEVVFAGSAKRSRASLAEVTLVFNNDNGGFPIEASEVEIGRRLYRSGETEYRVMGRSVRLGDLQLLLAQARIGVSSYAVVGQGMIDQMLISSPSERKLLFDEASGIRADELKREAALKRLGRAETNLVRLRDIRHELEPRLMSLERVAQAARKRKELEAELAQERKRLIAAAKAEIAATEARLTSQQERHAETELRLATEEKILTAALEEIKTAAAKAEAAKRTQRQRVIELENDRDRLMHEKTHHELRLQRLEQLQTELMSRRQAVKEVQRSLRQQERQERSIEREIEDLRAAVTRSENELERLQRPVKAAQAALVALRRQTDDGTQRQYIGHALSIVKVVAQNLNDTEPPLEQVKLLVHKAGRLLSHAAKKTDEDALRQLEAAQRALEEAMKRREGVVEHIANVTLSLRSQELELTHAQELARVGRRELERAANELETAETELGALAAVKRLLAKSEQDLERLTQTLTKLRQEEATTEVSGEAIATAAAALERNHGAVERLVAERSQTEHGLSELESLRTHYVDREQAWQLTAVSARSDDRSLSELDRHVESLELRLAAGLEAQRADEAEYAEVRTRYDELTAQTSDLETAQADLREVVERLDGAIKASFTTSFAAMAEHFSRNFERLFGGGKATLTLEPGIEGDFGIEIKASAKGKRLSSIGVMSGGERALTGIALLAAILESNPSPFIVLDEVDAALDETNSGRLASILAELAKHSQLIVVTHNRQTMAAADVLYGVTLGDEHSSRLLSLRLEAARALAAR